MKAVIINLHGFNSGPGEKAQELQKHFPNCQVIAPQLPYDPLQAVELVSDIIDQHIDSDVHVVGTSLGAFYAMYLSIQYCNTSNIFFYLINTSFEPHITLRRYEGKVITNYKTQQQFETTPLFFEQLKALYFPIKKGYSANCIYSSDYFIGTEDEVVDFTNFTNFIKSFEVPCRLQYSKQDHRFSDLSDVVKAIKYNSTLFI
jgi:predicted esterase YcpF (UPF0227 family)